MSQDWQAGRETPTKREYIWAIALPIIIEDGVLTVEKVEKELDNLYGDMLNIHSQTIRAGLISLEHFNFLKRYRPESKYYYRSDRANYLFNTDNIDSERIRK